MVMVEQVLDANLQCCREAKRRPKTWLSVERFVGANGLRWNPRRFGELFLCPWWAA